MFLAHFSTSAVELLFTQNPFETGKDYYTCKLTFTGESVSQEVVYRVTTTSGHMPAMRVGWSGNLDLAVNVAGISENADPAIGNYGGFSMALGNTGTGGMTVSKQSETTGPFSFAPSSIGVNGMAAMNNALITCVIDADFPIFASGRETYAGYEGSGEAWCFTGISTDEGYINECYNLNFEHVDQAQNFYRLEETINTKREYFIYSQVKANGITTEYKGFKFAILDDAEISLAHIGDTWNLRITEMPYKYMDLSSGGYSSISWTDANALLPQHVSYPYDEDFTEGGVNYTVWLYTNIPRFDSETERVKYEHGEIGIDSAIDGGGSSKLSPIGADINTTDIETSTFDSSVSGANLYLMTSSKMSDLKDYLFDPNHKTALQDGLWLWGNTPASVIVGLYYVPFDVTEFYTTTQAGVKFGSHVATDLGYYTIGTVGGKRKTLFSTSFEGKYGDFRDYEYMKYELYLPFVGRFIELDANKYLNKMIKCEMLFDAYKHEIRYYLFANGILQDRVDCNCGVDMPLISTDNVSKAKTDIATRFDDINNMAQGIQGAMLGKMGVGSIVSSVSGLVQNKMTRMTKPAETIQGGFSSSLNTFDIRYPYLRITEDLTVKPTKLNSSYNYPSYYIGLASQLHGYCECDDIQLVSDCTDREYNEIKDLLKGGVIF